MKRIISSIAAAVLLSGAAYAAPVDLSSWGENGFKGSLSAGNWQLQSGNNAVRQSTNGDPTVFFEAGSNAQGTSLAGTITPQSSTDDDFIGFVLGYQDGEMNSTNADFWLIDWKQGTQDVGGEIAQAGLALSHVTGDIANGPGSFDSFWSHTATVNEVQRATNLGSTGWVDPQEYTFELIFTANLIEVKVDGTTELSYTSAQHGSTFTDGAFGFYNFSQDPVLYAGITEDVLPPPSAVPLPAGLPLLLAGLGAFGWMRRRQGA